MIEGRTPGKLRFIDAHENFGMAWRGRGYGGQPPCHFPMKVRLQAEIENDKGDWIPVATITGTEAEVKRWFENLLARYWATRPSMRIHRLSDYGRKRK